MNKNDVTDTVETAEGVFEEPGSTGLIPPIHANQHYEVWANSDEDGKEVLKEGDTTYSEWYEVINLKTGVVEAKTQILPQALYLASAYDKSLRTKQYLPEEDRPEPEEKIKLVKPRLVN